MIKKQKQKQSSHILTDGTGAFEFLKSLLSLYTKHPDISLPPDFQFRKPGDEISEEEYEDGYNRYFNAEFFVVCDAGTGHVSGSLFI